MFVLCVCGVRACVYMHTYVCTYVYVCGGWGVGVCMCTHECCAHLTSAFFTSNLQRLDGREVYDYRNIEISIQDEPGRVEVTLGGTRYGPEVNSQTSLLRTMWT